MTTPVSGTSNSIRVQLEKDNDTIRFAEYLLSNRQLVRNVYLNAVLTDSPFPTNDFKHFSHPSQHIYLSATLSDPQDFQRRIGSDEVSVIKPSNPQPGERGRRMIVLFPSKEEGPSQDDVINKGRSSGFLMGSRVKV